MFGISFPSNGQHAYQQEWQAWFRIYNQTRFNEKLVLHVELDERIRLNSFSQFQIFSNTHIHYRLKPWMEIATGIGYIATQPSDILSTREWRPWQEASVFKKFGKDAIFQLRYRMEERFISLSDEEVLVTTHQYIWRNRFRFQFSKPIAEYGNHKTLTLKVSEEVIIRPGNDRLFDQNQLSASVELKLTQHLSWENGYVNLFQPITDYIFRDRHIIRTTLYHRIDIRKRS